MSQYSGIFSKLSFSSQQAAFSRRKIYESLRDLPTNGMPMDPDYGSQVESYVLRELNIQRDQLSTAQLLDLVKDSKNFSDGIRKVWKKYKSKKNFEKYGAGFLDKEQRFTVRIPKVKTKKTDKVKRRKITVKTRRTHYIDFPILKPAMKAKESAKVRKSHRAGAVIHASKFLIGRKGGRVRYADILIDRMVADPKYAEYVIKELRKPKPVKIAPKRFLAEMLSHDYSDNDQISLKALFKEHNANLVPSTQAIRVEKKACLDGIPIDYNNWEVKVPFPELRKKHLSRMQQIPHIVKLIKEARDEHGGEIEIIDDWKWGFDGLGDIALSNMRSEKKKKKPETEPNDNENAGPQGETEQGDHVREEEPDNDEIPDAESGDENQEEQEAINQARENLDPKPEFFTRTKLLVTQCVFLQLRVKPKPGEPKNGGKVIYRSRMTNCCSACKPLRVCFQKENKITVNREYDRVNEEINRIETYSPEEEVENEETQEVEKQSMLVHFHFNGIASCFDQSAVSNILGITSTASCPLCGRSPNEMSFRNGCFSLLPDMKNLKAFSNLHFGPRSMELCVHLGEKIDIKRHIAKTPEQIQSVADRKEEIQKEIFKQFGFWYDMPNGGSRSGNSNTGNGARAFYDNCDGIAVILKIPAAFIRGIKTVWEIMRCPFKIDPELAHRQCEAVLDMYFEYFKMTQEEKDEIKASKSKRPVTDSWYKIASSVHKILLHLKWLLENCPVPPGMTTEEATECNNQRIRLILIKLTRKMSMLKMLSDLVNRLIMISDPVMLEFTMHKAIKKRKVKPMSKAVRDMLANPDEDNLDEYFFDNDEIDQGLDNNVLDEISQDVEELAQELEDEQNDENWEDASSDEEESGAVPSPLDNPVPSTSGMARNPVPSTSGMARNPPASGKRVRTKATSDTSGDESDFEEPLAVSRARHLAEIAEIAANKELEELEEDFPILPTPPELNQRPKRARNVPERYAQESKAEVVLESSEELFDNSNVSEEYSPPKKKRK